MTLTLETVVAHPSHNRRMVLFDIRTVPRRAQKVFALSTLLGGVGLAFWAMKRFDAFDRLKRSLRGGPAVSVRDRPDQLAGTSMVDYESIVDEASVESFPASDPPSFSPSHMGAPRK